MESVRNWKQVSPYYTCVAVAAIFQLTSFVPCCFTNIPPFLLSLSLPPSLQVPLLTEQLDVALCKLHWSPSGQHLAWMVFTGSQYKSWIKDTSDLKTMGWPAGVWARAVYMSSCYDNYMAGPGYGWAWLWLHVRSFLTCFLYIAYRKQLETGGGNRLQTREWTWNVSLVWHVNGRCSWRARCLHVVMIYFYT